jgi:peptidoglycan/xylan/chitin deacetylase (PgdA/CDA1 family)
MSSEVDRSTDTALADWPLRRHNRYDLRPVGRGTQEAWPGGNKLAVYVAIGVEDYDFGGDHVENLLEGVPAPDYVNTSWRDYGNRVGAFQLLRRLEAYGFPPTILLNTAVYDSAPELIAEMRSTSSEIVGHGVSNSHSLENMSERQERAYLEAVAKRIQSEEGEGPFGWSSPWLTHTANTLDLLAETGYRYVLDFRLDDKPVALNMPGRPLVAIPYALELNDSTSVIGRSVSATEFADMIIDEFDELLLAATEEPLVMSIVVHSFISGVPFRLRQLTRALEHIAAHPTGVWLTQPRQIFDAASSYLGVEPSRREQP